MASAPAPSRWSLPVFSFAPRQPLSHWSRKNEFEADAYAARQADAGALMSALVKLYRDNASTLTPDPLYSARFHDRIRPPRCASRRLCRRCSGEPHAQAHPRRHHLRRPHRLVVAAFRSPLRGRHRAWPTAVLSARQEEQLAPAATRSNSSPGGDGQGVIEALHRGATCCGGRTPSARSWIASNLSHLVIGRHRAGLLRPAGVALHQWRPRARASCR